VSQDFLREFAEEEKNELTPRTKQKNKNKTGSVLTAPSLMKV